MTSMNKSKYRYLSNLGEGAYAKVFKCEKIIDGSIWACKKFLQSYKSIDEIHTISEIQTLKQLNNHPNIVNLEEILYNKRTESLYLIFELMDMDLYIYIKDRTSPLPTNIICRCMYSILTALEYIHRHGLVHRDVKPENILVKGENFKLSDFGMCRSISNEQRLLTDYVATRWYRAPECILTKGYYGQPIDIWSIGCVMFEILTLKPLFVSKTELELINKIHTIFGTPSIDILKRFEQYQNHQITFNFPPEKGIGLLQYLPNCSIDTFDLLIQMLIYDSQYRISASNALIHPYFDQFKYEFFPKISHTNILNNRSIQIDTKNILSIKDIPIIEINDDDNFVSKQFSTNEKEISTKNLSVEVLWEQLTNNALYYFNLFQNLFILAQKIDINQNKNCICRKSISNHLWQIFLFAQINMKKIHMNLQLMFIHIKTIWNIFIKTHTWKLTIHLLKNILQNLKKNIENSFILINELQNQWYTIKNEIISIVKLNTNIKSTEFLHTKYFIKIASTFISSIIKIVDIVFLNNKMISLKNKNLFKDYLNHKFVTNFQHVNSNNEIEKTFQLMILFEQQWDNIISLISIIELQLKLTLDTHINILIDQIQITDENLSIISEPFFIIELIKIPLIHLYENLCSFIIMFHIYLNVSDKFIKEFSLIHSYEQQIESCIPINNYSFEINTIQTYLTKLLTEQKSKYVMIFENQHDEFKNFFNQFSYAK